MNKSDFCEKHGLTEKQFVGEEEISSLDLGGLTSIPDGFNPTVGGYLYLGGLTSIPDGFNPTVGGYLDLEGLTSIPDGFNPTVGGSLDLRGLTSIPDGFNPTVGGSLDLRGLTSIPDGFNPTVGGYLDLRGGLQAETNQPPAVIEWPNGYCIADGIFGHVMNKRKENGRLIWKLKKINCDEIFYLMQDGSHVAHGKSIREALVDLRFKSEDRDSSDYQDLAMDDELTFDDAVICYRVITGACQFGVCDFIDNRLTTKKESYKVSELIELTKNEYGSESFSTFFQREAATA